MGLGRISTGSSILDIMLCGGYETDVVTTVYGPAGSGKTTLSLMCMLNIIDNGKKALFIDTEGGFSIARLEQLAKGKLKTYLENILLLKPTSFEEQKSTFAALKKAVEDDRIGIIVIDSMTMLYRLQMGKHDEVTNTNRELSAQVGILTEITRKKNIPILLTNQIYNSFDDKDKINMVGGDILKYGSKCLIELQTGSKNIRRVILRKHRSLPAGREELFKIENEGLVEVENI